MLMTISDISDFHAIEYTYEDTTRVVYYGGDTADPLVFLLHEIPNPTPQVFELGRRIIAEGYCVHIPVFFGKANRPFSTGPAIAELGLGCIRKAFSVFASDASSPILEWLRQLCLDRMKDLAQRKVGMIGMCFTGNFALGLCAEEWMQAPVLSQPSLPYPITKRHKRGLHMCPKTLLQAKQNPDLEILGLRFSEDWMCPRERFEELHHHFGERFESIEIDSSPSNPHGIRSIAHSVLTLDFIDEEGHPTREALDRVISFLHDRLH